MHGDTAVCGGKWRAAETHGSRHMTVMEDITEGLGKCVGGVDDTRRVKKAHEFLFDPFLNCEVLDVDVTSARCLFVCVSHHDSRLVVYVEWGSVGERDSQFDDSRPEMFGRFRAVDRFDEFGLGGRGGYGDVVFGPVCDDGAAVCC